MEFFHQPVLLSEAVEALNIKPDGVYVDGTAGGAGHSAEIAKRLGKNGRLIAIDRDPYAAAAASERLAQYETATVVKDNYSNIKSVLMRLGIDKADGILLDLGVSSFQLDTPGRGFSYHGDAPLDMRMSCEGISAENILNEYPEDELARIIFEYGEEKFARAVAANIVKARAEAPVETTSQLADIITRSVPYSVKRKKNPCKKTFQAIRIAVNGELEHLSKGLDEALDCLNSGGRLAVITFHSLEDRLVKRRFYGWVNVCACPPGFPLCVCGKQPLVKPVTKKPVEPGRRELDENIRSRSAKLRAGEAI